jgi:hypothetical protein
MHTSTTSTNVFKVICFCALPERAQKVNFQLVFYLIRCFFDQMQKIFCISYHWKGIVCYYPPREKITWQRIEISGHPKSA